MARLRDVLTTRGRAFVAAGVTLVVCGLALGFSDLTRIGVLLAALPLAAGLLARRVRPGLTITRTVTPSQVAVDQPAEVRLRFANATSRTAPLQLADERIDYVLGDRPRFLLPRMDPGDVREVTYAIRSHIRGRRQLGPLSLRVRDPFGLATSVQVAVGVAEILVLPKVVPLSGNRVRADGVGAEGEIPHMVALHGEDDVAIRGYRDGDDLRRIHWPATAHRGELMVRQEDRPARRRAVLVLDSRAAGHRGAGDSSSFEWAVTALASVTAHLAGLGYAVHLVSVETTTAEHAMEAVDVQSALSALALAEPADAASLEPVLSQASQLTAAGGLVVAAVTGYDEEMLRRLATLRQPGGSGMLFLLDAGSFDGAPDPHKSQALAEMVLGAGWSVVVVDVAMAVAAAWAALSASGSRMAPQQLAPGAVNLSAGVGAASGVGSR